MKYIFYSFISAKIGISAGNITIRLLGTPDFGRSMFMIGEPIIEAKYSEMLCQGGDVIISPAAWGLCTSFLYEYTLLDKNFVKVYNISPYLKRGFSSHWSSGSTRLHQTARGFLRI